MKKILSAFTVCLFLAMSFVFSPNPADAFAGKSPGSLEIKPQTSKIQLPFIANEGQIDNRVRYYAQTFNGSFFITQNGELVYSIEKPQKTDSRKERSERSVIREIFTGDIKSPSFKGEGEGTKISIYKGNEPAKWKRNIPSYEQISMGDIYQGIEIKLKAYGDTIEKIFSVKPGADPKAIRSRLEGAKNIQVNEKGELEFQTDIGTAVFSKPVAYQVKGQGEKNKEQREYVQVSYTVEGNQYSFKVGDYDKTRELVIDPYVGVKIQGSAEDRAYAVMTFLDEGEGETNPIFVFVAGYSYSSDFPVPVNQTFGASGTSDSDVFVAKLSEDLGTIERIVFIAGTGNDFGYSLAMDSANNVYVAGTTTSSNLPIPVTPFDATYNDGTDVFVAKLSYDLTSLIALTYLGGISLDAVNANSLAINGYDVIVTGYTTSTFFPTVTEDPSFDKTHNGGEDVFIAIFNTGLEGETPTPGLETLKSSTFIGGTGNERPYAIATRYNEIYVAGYTTSTDYPTTEGAYNETYNDGAEDAFISRIMSGDSPLEYLASSTFLGGSGIDEIHGLAIDSSYNYVYVTGNTNSSGFAGTCAHGPCGNMDAFIAQFGTFLTNDPAPVFVKLGGTSNDYPKSLILSGGMVFVSGVTYSGNFPTTINAFDTIFGGTPSVNSDGFVLRIDPSLTNFDASTYLGGSTDDFASAIASDTAGNIYVAGSTNSTDFPTTLSPYGSSSGNFEAYVAKLDSMLIGLYKLTVTKTGTGTGTVTSTETPTPKINCGSTCSALYDAETSVTLNATPSSNSVFAGWNGAGCTGTGSCTFAMNSNNTVIATFTKTKFTVTPIFDQHGTMNPSTPQVINSGQTVPFTITPSSGYRILYVGGSCGGSLSENVYTTNPVTADCNVMAFFTSNTLRVTASAGQGGSISPASRIVNYGETAQFTVTPDDGYHIASVTGCGVTKYEGGVIAAKKKKKNVKGSAAGEVYIAGPITESCTISASFAINTFTVTPSAGEHGNINPSTQQTVNYNDMVPFSVKADDGYHIQSVSGCNGTAYTAAKKKKKKKLSAVSEMTYTTGHITESCTVTASFAINTFTVTPKAGEHGSIDPSAPLTVNYLDTVSFTVKPDAGYHIESVTGCGVHPSEGGAYITDYVTGDCTVEAAFAKETFTATILKSGTGTGTITGSGMTCEGNACGGTYEAGSKLTLKIKPEDGYRVIDVKINGKSIGPVQTLTLKEIMSNFAIEIVFGPISP
jgi:hypothetical protein